MKAKANLNEIIELKKLNDNKIIMWADNVLKLTFKTIIDKTIRNFVGVPLSWEDLYYEFLYTIPGLVKEYDSNSNITIKTWLGLRCKYFAYNKCRSWCTKNNKVMNGYVSYSDNDAIKNKLMDPRGVETFIDISSLSSLEFKIYTDHFLNEISITEISNEILLSKYKVRNIIEKIKHKLSIQVKN